MDITAETIDKILEISGAATTMVTDANGRTSSYSDKPIHEVKAAPPATKAVVEVCTIQGLADVIRANFDNQDFPAKFALHVRDERTVELKATETDEWGRRLVLAKASPLPFKTFPFGQWITQEEFAISVAALFVETPDREYVLRVASVLTNEATSTTEDDGFTQRATLKAGLRTKEQVTLKPRVDLAPFRTFPEITQPVSGFVFRARTVGETPALMLVEADGGMWKLAAMQTIRGILEAEDMGLHIIS